jgi:colanic acid/amylovoran biosynthesis glycosyltransferase
MKVQTTTFFTTRERQLLLGANMRGSGRKTLYLFTSSYPYSSAAEDTFIEPELPHLHEHFSNIVIVPRTLQGKRSQVPPYIYVDTSLGEQLRLGTGVLPIINICLSALLSKIFYYELIKKRNLVFHRNSLMFLVYFSGVAYLIKKWLKIFLENQKPDLSSTLFYTYWLNEVPLGICQLKAEKPEMKIICRAHGGDMFEDRYNPPYLPFRPEIFQFINKIYVASKNGVEYLSKKYPDNRQIFEVSLLGVAEQQSETHGSTDGIFRIVSCSFLRPVKRINLLILGLKELGIRRKNQKFEWIHIGDGPLKASLEKLTATLLPDNIQYKFVGYLPNPGVIGYYKNNPIDIFINVSESEGGNPVSIMEAQSFGIPVIASAVGGNKEIISDKVGILLSPNPSPEEIARAVIDFIEDPSLIKERKINSKINWKENYNAEKNFSDFSQEIAAIVDHK